MFCRIALGLLGELFFFSCGGYLYRGGSGRWKDCSEVGTCLGRDSAGKDKTIDIAKYLKFLGMWTTLYIDSSSCASLNPVHIGIFVCGVSCA